MGKKHSTCAKAEFHKILGVGLGFIRKLTIIKPGVFFQVPKVHILRIPGKDSTGAKPELHKNPRGWPRIYQKADYYKTYGFSKCPTYAS